MLKQRKRLITNSLVEISENEGKGKGKYFVSKFIEAGLAHYKELGDIVITKETLDKFIQTMVGCPVIIDHEDVNDKNVEDLRVGVISRVWYNDMDGWYYCEGIITDDEAVNLIKNKGWSVSCAYSFVADESQKTYHGKPIDMVFTDGEFLHLAIVEEPRYEGANIVVNSKEVENGFITIDTETENERKKEEKNINNSADKENTIMSVLDELKEFILGVVSNEKEDEMKVKNEDKRKLIDEIGGILKDKVDDEIIRTVIKKAEELSYEPSEDDKADNKAKNEEDKDEAKNKCKNEEEKEEDLTKNEDDKEEKEDKKEVKNSMKDFVMGGKSEVEEKSLYISTAKRLELGNKY